jgi:hypothetical protein
MHLGGQMNCDGAHKQQQSDQMGRVFAHWAIFCFGQFLENYRSSPIFCATFSTVKVMR